MCERVEELARVPNHVFIEIRMVPNYLKMFDPYLEIVELNSIKFEVKFTLGGGVCSIFH